MRRHKAVCIKMGLQWYKLFKCDAASHKLYEHKLNSNDWCPASKNCEQ